MGLAVLWEQWRPHFCYLVALLPLALPFSYSQPGTDCISPAAQGTKPLLSETEQCPLSPCLVQFLVKLKGDKATKAMGHLTVPSQEVCGPHSGSCRPFSLQVLAFHGWSGPPISARNNSFHFKAFVCIPVSFTGIYALWSAWLAVLLSSQFHKKPICKLCFPLIKEETCWNCRIFRCNSEQFLNHWAFMCKVTLLSHRELSFLPTA